MTSTLAPATLHIGKGWFPEQSGGLDRYYYDLVRHLPPSGVAVHGLVTGTARVARDSDGVVRAFAPTSASLPQRWGGVRRHARTLLADHPELLCVTHFALYAAPCLDLMRGRPLVVHFHGPWAAETRAEGAGRANAWVKEQLERRVYARADRFVVLSRAFGRVLHEAYGVAEDRIDVIPGGVDCGRWLPRASRREAREQLGWPVDRPIVLVVRRLVRRMGLEDLIESIDRVRREVPDVLVLVAGRGPLAHELEARRREAGLTDHLRLLGLVPDDQLPLAYRAADLSVVPSVTLEGFGLVVAESLAAGTPVLVTPVGGLPETIADLAPECVIEGGNRLALGATIADALRGRLPLPSADACTGYARQRFDWSGVVDRLGATYRRAMQ